MFDFLVFTAKIYLFIGFILSVTSFISTLMIYPIRDIENLIKQLKEKGKKSKRVMESAQKVENSVEKLEGYGLSKKSIAVLLFISLLFGSAKIIFSWPLEIYDYFSK